MDAPVLGEERRMGFTRMLNRRPALGIPLSVTYGFTPRLSGRLEEKELRWRKSGWKDSERVYRHDHTHSFYR